MGTTLSPRGRVTRRQLALLRHYGPVPTSLFVAYLVSLVASAGAVVAALALH